MLRFGLIAIVVALSGQLRADDDPPEVAGGAAIGNLVPAFQSRAHVGRISELLFTPDNKRVVSVGHDRTVQIWDVDKGKRLKVWRLPASEYSTRPLSAALGSDGVTLVVSAIGAKELGISPVQVLNLDDGRVVQLPGITGLVTQIAISADGDRVVGVRANNAQNENEGLIWTGLKNLWANPIPGPIAEPTLFRMGRVRAAGGVIDNNPIDMALNNTGDKVAVVFFKSSLLALWDLSDPKKPKAINTDPRKNANSHYQSVCWTRNDQFVTSHYDGGHELGIWTTAGKMLRAVPFKDPGQSGGFYVARVVPLRDEPKGKAKGKGEAEVALYIRSNPKIVEFRQEYHWVVLSVGLTTGTVQEINRPGAVEHLSHTMALSADRKYLAIPDGPNGSRVALIEAKPKALRATLPGDDYEPDMIGWATDSAAIGWSTTNKAKLSQGISLTELESVAVGSLTFAPLAVKKRSGLEIQQSDSNIIRALQSGKEIWKFETVRTIYSFTLPATGPLNWVAVAHKGGFVLLDPKTGKVTRELNNSYRANKIAPSPDGRFLLVSTFNQVLAIYATAGTEPLLVLYPSGSDWVMWAPKSGYYAASPNGERLMGWTINNGTTKAATFYEAQQFRKQMYRPDIIKAILQTGDLTQAIASANAKRPRPVALTREAQTSPDKLLPPIVSVKILDESKSPKYTVQVTAKQGCAEQPIKSLRLLVDNHSLQGGQGRIAFPIEGAKKSFDEKWEIELPPGPHRLAVIAQSVDESPGISEFVVVEKAPLALQYRPTLHHLAVGIDDYDQKHLRLTASEADARNLTDAFTVSVRKGLLFREIASQPLLSKDASRDKLLAEIAAFRLKVQPNDLFVISFAGHGTRKDDEFYLLTKEADDTNAGTLAKTCVSGTELRKALTDFPCQVLLLLDACHSGQFASLRPVSDEAARAMADVETHVTVICAARGNEFAIAKDGKGLFSTAVADALQKKAGAVFDPVTGDMTVFDLMTYLDRTVAKESDGKQTPCLHSPPTLPRLFVARFPVPAPPPPPPPKK